MLLYAPAEFACIISAAIEVALDQFEKKIPLAYKDVMRMSTNPETEHYRGIYEAAAIRATASSVILTYAYANPFYFPATFWQFHENEINTAVVDTRLATGIIPVRHKRKSKLQIP